QVSPCGRCQRAIPPPQATRSVLVWRDNTLLEHKAAVESALPGLHDAIGLLGQVVERETLDSSHRRRLAFGTVDLRLDLGGNGQDLAGVADHLHPERGIGHKAV